MSVADQWLLFAVTAGGTAGWLLGGWLRKRHRIATFCEEYSDPGLTFCEEYSDPGLMDTLTGRPPRCRTVRPPADD